MPVPVAKVPFTTIGIHKAPTHLTRETFYANIHTLADAHLGLPPGKNILKYQLILPNDRLDEPIKALGLPAPQTLALTMMACETPEHFAEFFGHPDIAKSVAAAPEFQEGAILFSADAGVRLDRGSQEDSLIAEGIFRRPVGIPMEQFYQTLNQFADTFCALPTAQKNVLKYTMWTGNESAANAVDTPGVPLTRDPVVVVLPNITDGEQSIEAGMEIGGDAELKELAVGLESSGVLADAYWFCADIATKCDRSE
ncbi:hypothetical protein B0H16DRAFT_1687737 [Mycena metata]|uniref:Uncharacterized protein n=1 Tax=Mycena metata TaxID=1033252 RepID=A0AAD7JJW0_9AGAR|nr:hypothetical protein B0H16DRAFT_1687737 [Mycena metata]